MVFQFILQKKFPLNFHMDIDPFQLTPAHQIPTKKTPSGVFYAWMLAERARKIRFRPFRVGRFPKILPAPVFRCVGFFRVLGSVGRCSSTA